MPIYLDYLKTEAKDSKSVSAKTLASALGLGEIQVRKDLATVSDKGKPKVGYNTNDLISDIEEALGYKTEMNAIIVGAGKLGKALIAYKGFSEYGLSILFAFDSDPEKVGTKEGGRDILPIERLAEIVSSFNIKIGIITVPSEAAQAICTKLVDVGIKAIWNFAPTHLTVPEGVLVKNENMAASLALLSQHINL